MLFVAKAEKRCLRLSCKTLHNPHTVLENFHMYNFCGKIICANAWCLKIFHYLFFVEIYCMFNFSSITRHTKYFNTENFPNHGITYMYMYIKIIWMDICMHHMWMHAYLYRCVSVYGIWYLYIYCCLKPYFTDLCLQLWPIVFACCKCGCVIHLSLL